MNKQQEKLELILKIENKLKGLIYLNSTIDCDDISTARRMNMISFIGRVKSNKKIVNFYSCNTNELYFIFDRFVALELSEDGQYSIVWTLYTHEVADMEKMVSDAEKLAGLE